MGRHPKAPLTVAQRERVALLRQSGWGWESIAHEISLDRAAKVATAEARAAKSVSHTWLRRQFSNESLSPTKQQNPRSRENLQRNHKSTGDVGPRINPSSLEETSTDFLQGPVKESPEPTGKVEVASGGSKT